MTRDNSRKTLTLFGITQTPWQWANDPRCEVSYRTIRHRMARGWPADRAILKLAAPEPRNETERRVREQFEAHSYDHGELGKFRTLRLAEAAILAKSGKGFVIGSMTAKMWRVPLPVRQRGNFRQTPKEKKAAAQELALAEVGRVFNGQEVRQVIGTSKVDLLPSFDGRLVAVCFDRRTNPLAPDLVIIEAGPLLESMALRAARHHPVIPVFRKRRIKEEETKWRGWEYMGHFKVKAFDRSPAARKSAQEAMRDADTANPRRGHSVDHKVWDERLQRMLELAEQGLNYKEIAAQTGVPKTSVFRYIRDWQLERISARGPAATGPAKRPPSKVAKTAAPKVIAGMLILERVDS